MTSAADPRVDAGAPRRPRAAVRGYRQDPPTTWASI